MDEDAPRVFVSYSHDSPEHKRWVAELSAKLRHDGIDVILDQWDLSLGDDITKFMEDGLSSSDRVILICTENYVRKADAGVGGVAYERMIVTAELVQNLGTQKFIPVIRQGGDKPILPKFLGARFYVNFSEGQNLDTEYENLLRELHKQSALTKPPLGKSPFAQQPSGQEIPEKASKSEQVPLSAVSIKGKGINEIYEQGLEIARQGDLVAWRQLIKDTRSALPASSLKKWRMDQQLDQKRFELKDLPSLVDDAVQLHAPLMAIALAGISSGREKFRDQKSVVDDLANPSGWGRSGLVVVVEIPAALVFGFHSLCGATCLDTDQLDQAVQLGLMKIASRHDSVALPLVRRTDLNGWPQSLGGDCNVAWEFMFKAVERWPWLSRIFGSEED